jgi:uncharacterized protein YcfJ
MNSLLKTAVAATVLSMSAHAMAQITLYEHDGWRGRTFATSQEVANLSQFGFNDRASSVIVEHGEWELCDDAGFRGKCIVLRHGSYASLGAMGMTDRISSLRPVGHRDHYDNEGPPPQPQVVYEYRRRPDEEVFQVPVTSVRALYGSAQQRCWTEQQQVSGAPPNSNAGGALVGAILGGVLGHQVGGGRGRDVATAGGAVAGAVIGSNVGTGGGYSQDVQRCETVPNQTPDAFDVTYNFHGLEHHIQTRYAPGPSVVVNRDGEPRQ